MKKIMLIGLIVICRPAFAEWVIVGETINAKTYLENKTVKKEGANRKYWKIFNRNEIHPTKRYLSVRTYMEVRCKEWQIRSIEETWWSGKWAQGEDVSSSVSLSLEWRHIAPDTIGEAAANIVCKM